MTKAIFKIRGMDCAEEVAVLKDALAPLPGVENLAFDVLNGKLTVDHVPDVVSRDALVAAIAKTGMQAEVWNDAGAKATESTGFDRWGKTAATAASGVCLAAGFSAHALLQGWQVAIGGHDAQPLPLASRILYLMATIAGSGYVLPKALRSIVNLRPDMNLLMSAAILGAIAIGEYFEAGTVAFLFSLSLVLESWSVGRARRAIAALLSLSPDTARVLDSGGGEREMEVKQVPVGGRIVVRPGEKIPLDGEIAAGETTVNQAPITGESLPVAKQEGSQVFAGTINQDGAIEVITTKRAEDTTLARIVRMVGDAQSQRSPSEQWVETFARYYTPAVMVLALVVMFLPPLALGGEWWHWFYEGLVLLVIACPCALVISTPVSIVAALTASARQGVLVKGGAVMEVPAKLRAIAVDKTGTLTEGKPEVKVVVPLSGHSEAEVLEIAAAVEMRSTHPLAQAIVRAAEAQGIRPDAAQDFQTIQGKGAMAKIGDRLIWIGSHRLLEERGQETPEMHARLEDMEREGASVVVVGKNEHVCGLIAIADRIRSNAREAINALRAEGIEHIVLLTGDNLGTGEAIGRAAGVDEVQAGLLPHDKVAAVEDLVKRFGQVAMVGDGVNDAPAMARANLGIAMGVVGTDAALETADVALMGDDLLAVPWLIRQSRRTLTIIRQNIIASLAVKVLFVVLTVFGQASLWAAIAADTGMSLLVIFNALRLLKT